jgi:hypothetical protein
MTEAIEKALKERFPDSTDAECFRFVQAAKAVHKKVNKNIDREKQIFKTANDKLGEYLKWRILYGIDHDRPTQNSDDKTVWDWAVRKAFSAEATRRREAAAKRTDTRRSNSNTKRSSNSSQEQPLDRQRKQNGKVQSARTLPQLIFKRIDPQTGDSVRDKNGIELIQVLPARVDRFAADKEVWALAVALYIDICVDRNSRYKASIMVDARAGAGWANPVLIMVVSLIGEIVKELDERHPGRCASLIIFPIPRALKIVWNGIKKLFSPEMNEKLVVCSGPSDLGSPLPRKKLEPYIDIETLEYLEKCRTQLFVEEKKK